MRRILSKSKHLIVFFASAAILFSIGFTTLQESYQRVSVSPDYLSSTYYKIQVRNPSGDSSPLQPKEFYEYCKKSVSDALVYQPFDTSKGKAVFFTDSKKFTPKITEGRNFAEADFESQSNTAIVSNEMKSKCIRHNGKTYFLFDGAEYEVIGVFQVPKTYNSDIVVPSKFYVNMCAKANTRDSDGRYLFDTPKLSSDYSLLKQYVQGKYPAVQMDRQMITLGGKESLRRAVGFSPIIYLALFVTVVLVLLNAAVTTENWVSERKREIAVRELCGATSGQIKSLLFRNYISIISISYLIGVVITEIIVHSGFLKFMGTNVHLFGAVIGYAACLLCGIVAGFHAITRHTRHDIILQMRQG